MKLGSRAIKSAFLAFGSSGQVVVALLLAAILSRLLSKTDYATYRQTFLAYSFCAPLMGLGLPAAILYFLPREPDRSRSTIAEILLVLTLVGTVFAVAILLGGAEFLAKHFQNPDLAKNLKWFALFPLLTLPLTVLRPALVATNRTSWVPGFTIGVAVVRLVSVISLLFLVGLSPIAAIQGLILGALLVLPVALYLMHRVLPSTRVDLRVAHTKSVLAYSIPLGLATMVAALATGVDKVLVAAMTDQETFAVFVNGAMEIPFVAVITGSAASVLTPDLARLYAEGNTSKCIEIWQRSAQKTSLIIFPLMLVLFVTAEDLMVILYSEKYAASALPFQIYLLLLPIRVVFYGPLFQAAGKGGNILFRQCVTLLINVVLTIYGIKYFGALGAAAASVVSVYLFAIPHCIVTASKLMHTRPRDLLPLKALWRTLVLATFPLLLAVPAHQIIPEDLHVIRAAVLAAVYFPCLAFVFHKSGAVDLWEFVPPKIRSRRDG